VLEQLQQQLCFGFTGKSKVEKSRMGKPIGAPKSGGRKAGTPNKRTLYLSEILDEAENPIQMLVKVFEVSMENAQNSKSPAHLAIACSAASTLMSYRYPKPKAVSLDSLFEKSEIKPMTTAQAIAIIKADPFGDSK
jgi:hypothetical protein